MQKIVPITYAKSECSGVPVHANARDLTTWMAVHARFKDH